MSAGDFHRLWPNADLRVEAMSDQRNKKAHLEEVRFPIESVETISNPNNIISISYKCSVNYFFIAVFEAHEVK